jgi:hypothetical protein
MGPPHALSLKNVRPFLGPARLEALASSGEPDRPVAVGSSTTV